MNEIDKERFGAFLAELRKEKGLTQQEVAERLFVTNKAVSKWERGLSIPDAALLLPLAELLGVTVTELLRGERMETDEPMEPQEVERLVGQAIHLSSEEQAARELARGRWKVRYLACLVVVVLELAVLLVLRIPADQLLVGVGLVEALCLFFGGYFCVLVRETLPSYYDENKIHVYSDGIFRMNFPGITFNNRNWPHILKVCRIWMLAVPVADLPAYALLWWLTKGAAWFALAWPMVSVALCCGFFIPVAIVGKKYE